MTLKLKGTNSGSVSLDAPANTTGGAEITFTLPVADGSANQVLKTDGSGQLSFTTIASDAITEGNTSAEVVDTGSDGHFKVTTEGTERLRVDSSGNINIDSGAFYFDATNNRFGIGTTSPTWMHEVYKDTSSGSTGVYPASVVNNPNGSGYSAFYHFVGSTIKGGLEYNNSANILKLGAATQLTFCTNSTDTERARIDSSGRLLVGTTSAPDAYVGLTGQKLTVASDYYQRSTIAVINYENDAVGGGLNLGHSRNTTVGSQTIVQNGDQLGVIRFCGSGGTAMQPAAFIRCEVDGAPSSSNVPGRLLFMTTASGGSLTERMRILSNGGFRATTTGSYQNTSAQHHEFVTTGNNNIMNIYHTDSNGANCGGLYLKFTNAAPNGTGLALRFDDSSAMRFLVRTNGGIANYQSNDSNLCDEREKKNIVNLDSTWDCLKHWELKKFHYNEDPDTADLRYGVIAQQVAEYCPEVISEWTKIVGRDAVLDDDGNEVEPAVEEVTRMGVKEQQMYWMAIKALQEAQTRIETLETANAALEARLTALEGGAN